jgi:pectate lyase
VNDIIVAVPAFEVSAEYAIVAQDPKTAYELILAGAGAILPKRDMVDARIVLEVKNRTGKIINSQSDVGGYPTYNSTKPPADADNDGMPDEWEKRHGLNPADPTDGARVARSGYSHLEEYLNSLDGKVPSGAAR